MNRAWVIGLNYCGFGIFLGGMLVFWMVSPRSPVALALIAVGTMMMVLSMMYAWGYEQGYHRGKEHGVAEGTSKTYRWLNRGDDE